MASKSVLAEFTEYMGFCFPKGVPNIQYSELKRAFFAGANVSAIDTLSKAGEINNEMVQRAREIAEETFAYLSAQVDIVSERN